MPMFRNIVLTPEDYDRDIRHYEFDLKGTGFGNYRYSCTDLICIKWQCALNSRYPVHYQKTHVFPAKHLH